MAVAHRVSLPPLGDATTAVLIEWHVSVGEDVTAGQPLATVEAGKVDVEVPSPVGGTLAEVVAQPGAELEADAVICVVES